MIRNLISILLFTILFSPQGVASCNLRTDIEVLPDGKRVYTEACHKFVGKIYLDLQDEKKKTEELNKQITLMDLQIQEKDFQIRELKTTVEYVKKEYESQLSITKFEKYLWGVAGFGVGGLIVNAVK